jgi:glycosyltransferase involved in cell wall biosynthesis
MTETTNESNPFVSVVTPVYNGAENLAECIESVLSQSYQNFEFVILNNASTDDSASIMKRFAERDSRIRIENNDQILPIMQNWNHAVSLMSPDSKYCKVVHADDIIFPECIAKMVAVAEKYPDATLVGAYRINGIGVAMDSIPYPQDLVDGKELARGRLLTRKYRDQFGAPTSVMYRADCVRDAKEFYDTSNFHADTQTCFELLEKGDYAYVHDILTYTRRHEESQTSNTAQLDPHALGHILIQHKMGPAFLTTQEQQYAMNRRLRFHYRRLAKDFKYFRNKEFRTYHQDGLNKIGIGVSPARLVYAALLEAFEKVRNALRSLG